MAHEIEYARSAGGTRGRDFRPLTRDEGLVRSLFRGEKAPYDVRSSGLSALEVPSTRPEALLACTAT